MLPEQNNIEQFDALFRSELSNHAVPAPEGVWESVASQIGSASTAATGTAAATAAKAGLGIKTLIAVVTIAASVTAGVIIYNNSENKQSQLPATASEQVQSSENHTDKQVPGETYTGTSQPGLTPEDAPQTGHNTTSAPAGRQHYGATPKQNPVSQQPQGNNDDAAASGIQPAGETANPPAPKAEQPKPQAERTAVLNPCRDGKKANARFTYQEDMEGRFSFKPERSNQSFTWDFGDGSGASDRKPSHNYTAAGQYTVTVIALNENGCSDTFRSPVINHYMMAPVCPDVFTPEGDGLNDEYQIMIRGEENFHLQILDRSNKVVFETSEKAEDNKSLGWNGMLPDGSKVTYGSSYLYILNYKLAGGTAKTKTGVIYVTHK